MTTTPVDAKRAESGRHRSKGSRPKGNFSPRNIVVALAVFILGSLSFGAWAASSSIGSTPDSHYHLPSIVCSSYSGNVCDVDEPTGFFIVPEALIEGLSCTTQRPWQSAGCQPLMDGSDTRLRAHGDVNALRNLYPYGFYETMHVLYQDNLELAFVSIRWFNGILFVALTMLLWWASPLRVRSTIQWMWPIVIVPLGMFFIASANPTSWAVIGVGTGWIALLGFLESRGVKAAVLVGIYFLTLLLATSARIDATLFILATSLLSFWLANVPWRKLALRSWPFVVPFVAGIIFVVVRLVQRPGNIGVVSQGFGERGNRFEEITWSSLQQEVTFGPASPTPLLDWNLLWRNFLEVPGLWLGVFGGYPWGSLGWLDTTLPQIVPLIVLTVIMAVATTALKDSNWRQITAVIGMFGILWFIPLYLLQIGGYKVGEEFQPRYLIPLVVVLVGVMVLRPTGAPQVLSSPKALALIAVSLGVANSIALHTNIRRYVTGLDIGGLDLNYAREWWWWFMPQFFTPNWLWVGGSLAFFGVTWIVVYYLPRQAALANALAQKS